MPCPEETPCSEVRQTQVLLQNADRETLLETLRADGWKADVRAKGVGLFFTRRGITGTWEQGKEMRLEGMNLQRANTLRRILVDYIVATLEKACRETGWSVRDMQGDPTGTKYAFSRSSLRDDLDIIWLEYDTAGMTRIDCPPITADNLEAANAFLARLASPELAAINKRDGQMRDWLRTRALPSPLQKSAYQLPISLIEDVETTIRAYYAERDELIAAFIATYPDRYDEAVQALDGIFNALDYPISSHELRAFPEKAQLLQRSFSARHSYIRFDIDRNLETVDPELYRRQARQAAQEWRELIAGVSQMLKIEMANLTAEMLEKLNGATPAGRQKVIRSTFLPNVRDFLSVVDSRNINNDAEITRLAQQMRTLVAGVDDDALKRSVNCRAAIQTGFQCISAELSKMITDRPTRAISFDDDDLDAAA